jgi:hypothetical protein
MTPRIMVVVVVVTAAMMGAAPRVGEQPDTSSADLDGVWTFSTLTPLERPPEFAAKLVLSDKEAADFEKRTIERNDRDRRDQNPDADVNGAYNEAWFERGTRVAIVNGTKRASLIVDPPDGRIPALTTDGQRRAAERAAARREHPADGPEDRLLAERCLLFNAGPPLVPGPYNNYVQLIQFADHVVIFNEMIHDARVVPVHEAGGHPHLPPAVRKWLGDSIGRWDGRTLVVDTTNFTDRTSFRGASENMHLVERFTPVDSSTVLYEFTVDDPATFTKPWSAALPMKKVKDPILEYACHEANYAMADILRGARAEEKGR